MARIQARLEWGFLFIVLNDTTDIPRMHLTYKKHSTIICGMEEHSKKGEPHI